MAPQFKGQVNRIASLDVARFIFAFWVVVVHVPIWGRILLQPIACMAVPFFYILTGYFLYSPERLDMSMKMLKSLKHYTRLWVIYFVLLFGCICVLRLFHPTEVLWTSHQFKNLFFFYGNCTAYERISIGDRNYGCSTLWFLYGGMLSLVLLYLFKKLIFTKGFAFFVAIVWISFIILTYDGEMRFPRPIGASFPYLYSGLLIAKNQDTFNKYKASSLLIAFFCFVVFLYLEAFFFRAHSYGRFFLLPSSVFIFVLLLRCQYFFQGKCWGAIPKRTSLDIYIWHRLWFAILSGVFGLYLYQFDAIIIFLSLGVISASFRCLTLKI